jgi:hypothetical protein
MNPVAFAHQVDLACALLDEHELLAVRNHSPVYERISASDYRHISYEEVWKKLNTEGFFDVRLTDLSLIQFRHAPSLSYAYYECPYAIDSYEKFVLKEMNFEIEREDIDDSWWEEFEEYATTQPLKDAVTPIRYDYDPTRYNENRHPASHFHFGYNSEIRLGAKRILKPISFACFVMRHCYQDSWERLVCRTPVHDACKFIRTSLDKIDDDHYRDRDQHEMYLE